jgi:hypothetical protein
MPRFPRKSNRRTPRRKSCHLFDTGALFSATVRTTNYRIRAGVNEA